MINDTYAKLAPLFRFPGPDYVNMCHNVQAYFDKNHPEIGSILSQFTTKLDVQDITIHELFVRSFDVQAVTTLDVGYVLFGDDYKRGELLANLNREIKENNIENGNELSDNLSNVLQLMSAWKDAELRVEFAGMILFPALIKMSNEFNPNRIEEKNVYYKKAFKTVLDAPENVRLIYKYCLEAVIALLKKEFPQITVIHNDIENNDFLMSLSRETTIDKSL